MTKKRKEKYEKAKQEAAKFGYHIREGKTLNGRWRGFNAQAGEAASECRTVEITDEERRKYENG